MPRTRRFALRAAPFILAAVLSGCASPRSHAPSVERVPSAFSERYYREVAAEGARVYRVDAGRSLVTIEVRRAGTLAKLGHDHVVASHDVHGLIAPEHGRADLYLPLQTLTVDEAKLRQEAGFEESVPQEAIAATRRNMLGSVLHADRYPFAFVSVRAGRLDRPMTVQMTIDGVTRTLPVAVRLDETRDELRASGELALTQTEFGIPPLAVLGGAIRVADDLKVRFTLDARRTAMREH